MTCSAVKLTSISKNFKVYSRPRDVAVEVLTGRPRHSVYTALDDVSLDLAKGSVTGLIGRNGAGKSTLLRVIAGTLEPTAGTIEVDGKISAILELGTGFNPEYTGRQNIYLGGLCLGLTRAEIREREESIIAFSELERFIDQPFRTYSSGMQARLTFSVAVAVDPDILIIDEALSVGDASFQRKCFRRLEEFRAAGATILLVTHQPGVIETICDRAVYMGSGKVIADGAPRHVVGQYLKDLFGSEAQSPPANGAMPSDMPAAGLRYGTGEVTIIDCGLLDSNGLRTNRVRSGQPCALFCDIRCNVSRIDDINVGLSCGNKEGLRLFGANSQVHRTPLGPLFKDQRVRVRLEVDMNLGSGDYFLTFGAWGLFADKHYDRRVDAVHIQVEGDHTHAVSLVNVRPRYSFEVTEEEALAG